MDLSGIKGSYDAIFSLGQNCLPSIQLENHGLRPFAGVLDWMISDTMADVNRLLANRFSGFMEHANLRVMGKSGGDFNFMVKDEAYNMISVHDFPVSRNTEAHLATYGEFKQKLERRAARFLQKAAASRRVLFVRMLATFEEASELEAIAAQLVTHDFRILIVNYGEVPVLIEQHWPLERVCSVMMPAADVWNGESGKYWDFLLHDIHSV